MTDEIKIIVADEIVQQDMTFNSQVDIAKRYPRNLTRVIQNAIAIATMDNETADTCNYTLPRAGKKISGASVHLARIIVQCYGNMRVESKISYVDATQIYAEAVCFDLETNIAVKVQVSRSILYSKNHKFKANLKYDSDMINTTGKVSAAIAYRNAVFSVIPKSIINKVYREAMQLLTGDLSSEAKLIKTRMTALKTFKDECGVEEIEILKSLGLNTINQIKGEQIVILRGMLNSIREGEFTVDEIFERISNKEESLKDPKINKPNETLTFDKKQNKKQDKNEK